MMKLIFFEDLTQERLNEEIDKGVVFIVSSKDSLLSQQSIVCDEDSTGSVDSRTKIRLV